MTDHGDFLTRITKRGDVMLAALMVAVIFMMIIPLPTQLVDALIAFNMSVAAILLMVALYLETPLNFAAFPSVLLITTLFRLALSITTTRLVLLQADAGRIVETFGNFVVAGNLVVGMVIFLIITIVQFIVVTKGAERVAEVGARFSLDAMPGKQLSIDGDMRAGVIDLNEARRRRGLVEKESQLYGAMDGAMKFVKGDAIAGLIVIAVNLLGGIAVGVLQHDLSFGEALHTYSILTIGDGLVGQIPALFIAITAGIIVTRVSSDDSHNLGSDIGRQVLAQPRALLIGAAICMGFAIVPGMPITVFVVLGSILGGGGLLLQRAERRAARMDAEDESQGLPSAFSPSVPAKKSLGSEAVDDFALTVPLMVDLAQDIRNRLDTQFLNQELIRVRKALYHDLGAPFPGVHLRFDENLSAESYVILVDECPISQGRLKDDMILVRESSENLETLGISFTPDKEFLPGIPTRWVAGAEKPDLRRLGISFFESSEILTFHLAQTLKKYAPTFVGIQETQFLLKKMEEAFPELLNEVQRVISLQKISEIFQRLVAEEISIRNLRLILSLLVEWAPKEKDVVLLTEYLRGGLKRQISYQYARSQNLLPAYLLAPDVEDAIRNAIRQTSSGSYLALDPEVSKNFLDKLRQTVGDLHKHVRTPVLLAAMDVRRYTKKLVENEFETLPVLSYQELTPEVTVQPIARVALE